MRTDARSGGRQIGEEGGTRVASVHGNLEGFRFN